MPKKIGKISGICPYCLCMTTEYEREHIIPRKWFTHGSFPYRKPLIIYVCRECNNKKSPDDEWMRMWFSTLSFDRSRAAEMVLTTVIKRSVENGNWKHQFTDFHSKMELTNQLPSGLYLPGKMTLIKITENDWKRISNYVDIVVRGLIYLHIKAPLPENYQISTLYACDELLKIRPQFQSLFKMIRNEDWRNENWEVFQYGLSKTIDADQWLCVTAFFNTIVFVSFIAPQGALPNDVEGRK